jgi:Protein of unknown function (DUF2510)
MTGDGGSPAGWHPDPFGRHQSRYWDGKIWTAHVANGGVASTDSPLPTPQSQSQPANFVPVVSSYTAETPRSGKGKWILVGGLAVVVIIVIAAVAGGSDNSTSSGGGTFKIKIADQAVFESVDFGNIRELAQAENAPGVCDDAAQSLQEASGIVAGWSTPLQNAWNAAEGHFETALTACRASDGEAMVRAYGRAESTLVGLRTLLTNLDCRIDPNDGTGEICK